MSDFFGTRPSLQLQWFITVTSWGRVRAPLFGGDLDYLESFVGVSACWLIFWNHG